MHPREEAEVDLLFICMPTFWFKAVLLSTLPGGLLGDLCLPTTLSVSYHSPVWIADPFPLPLQWVVEAGRGTGTRGGIRYLCEPPGTPGCSVEVPTLRGDCGLMMCGG